jgi:N-methylhydantoinase A
MYATLVPLMARKGINLDDFALLAFGGAGPTHGFLLAREVGIRRVIVPLHPGVLCATGSLVADVRRDFVRTLHLPLRRSREAALIETMREGYRVLSAEGREWLDAQRLPFLATEIRLTADLRYLGQSFDLTIPVTDAELADATGEALRQAFHAHYRQVYGYTDERADLEILDIRASAVGLTPKPRLAVLPSRGRAHEGSRPGRREVFHDGRRRSAVVLDRRALAAGERFDGPVIVEQYDTTTFVPTGFTVSVDRFGNLIGEAG